jgi:hypothetical protein
MDEKAAMTVIKMYVIYERPKDYPDRYVLRQWIIDEQPSPTGWFVLADTLEAVRAFVPPYCIRFERNPSDEPQIVESWI